LNAFAGIAIVQNVTSFPMPRKLELTRVQLAEMYSWQRRKHLHEPLIERDKDGTVVRTVQPLTAEDRIEMEDRELKVRLQELPHVGDTEYRFRPAGEQGSVWMMPEGHAHLLCERFPEILKPVALRDLGKLPAGVTPMQPGRIPSPNLVSYGAENPDGLPHPQAAAMSRALIMKDGEPTSGPNASGDYGLDTDQIPRVQPLLDERRDVYPDTGQPDGL